MFERIVEIIVYVIAELKDKSDLSDINFDLLASRGYTSSEISAALSWIADKVKLTEKFLPFHSANDNAAFRILHDAENELFTKEAWGEIVQLHSLKLLSNEQIETLIDKAFYLGMKKIDKKQLHYFIANIVFNAGNTSIGGSRLMLQGNDTIN